MDQYGCVKPEKICFLHKKNVFTLPKTQTVRTLHEAGDQKGNSSEPTPVFQVRAVSFRESTCFYANIRRVKKPNKQKMAPQNVS